MAVKATPGVLSAAKAWRDRAKVRLNELRKEHEALSERISDVKLVFYARAGETGKLYGSVTTNDIVDSLNKTLGTSIDRRNVVGEPLRQLGEHHVTVHLSRDYHPQVTVRIHPEGTEPVARTADVTEADMEEIEIEAVEEETSDIEDFEEALEV